MITCSYKYPIYFNYLYTACARSLHLTKTCLLARIAINKMNRVLIQHFSIIITGLPWIWNLPSLSISIFTNFPWISTDISMDIHGYIHIHRRLSCVRIPLNFCEIQQFQRVHSPSRHFLCNC